MAGIATDLLPGDAELARRAAGGDGAAFVHLYDEYSAEIFEVSLEATGEVETAADATQAAFLKLLRRPPAMAAPNSEVAERLRALALAAAVEQPLMSRRTDRGTHAPYGAGVGWLRSETVAKAGARFDDDWSAHLSQPYEWRPVRRVATERPLAAPVPAAASAQTPVPTRPQPVAAADPLPPLRSAPPARTAPAKRRRRTSARPAWSGLPSPAMAAAVLLLTLFAGTAGLVLTNGGATGGDEPPSAATAVATARPQDGAPLRRAGRDATRATGGRPARPSRAGYLPLTRADRPSGTDRAVVPTSGGAARRTTAGARLHALSPRTGPGRPQRITSLTRRAPTVVKDPEPALPAPQPAPVDQPPPTQTAEPAPTSPTSTTTTTTTTTAPTPNGQANHGADRNCNSRKAGC